MFDNVNMMSFPNYSPLTVDDSLKLLTVGHSADSNTICETTYHEIVYCESTIRVGCT